MGKRKKSKPCDKTIVINGIQPDELKQIFIEALLESEEIKKKNEQKEKEEEAQRFREEVGYKDYSHLNNPWQRIRRFFNDAKVDFKILFMSKKKIKGNTATSALLKAFLVLIFDIINVGLKIFYIGAIIYLLLQAYSCFTVSIVPIIEWYFNILLFNCAFSAFVFSRFIRMASIEIEKTEDNNYLFGVYASVASIASIIAAVIAVITVTKGG